jgi:hypothetical protein
MAKEKSDEDPILIIYIGAATIPISLIFLFQGEKMALKYIEKKNLMIERSEVSFFETDYCELNPTSFLHKNVNSLISNENQQEIWENLVKYSK